MTFAALWTELEPLGRDPVLDDLQHHSALDLLPAQPGELAPERDHSRMGIRTPRSRATCSARS